MGKILQPARKSYFFDKGYRDLGNTICEAWSRNGSSIKRYAYNLQNIGDKAVLVKIFLIFVNIIAMIAVVICGSVITAFISVINVLILIIFMAVVYVSFSVIWAIDRFYLTRKKIFTACHECKEKSLIPTYICPVCRAKHTMLTPGVYGILKRTCRCGEKIPTTFFNGRKNLEAECPHCGSILMDRESRPICIPVVGGRSVGKTAFINAFSKEFIEKVAQTKGFDIKFYNSRKEEIYREITQDYLMGSTRITDRPQDIHENSSISFSFFLKHPNLLPDRLVHIYDIAGEVFTDNSENEVQKQYEYCQGIVLIIDPFAIPSVRYKYEEFLTPEDLAGIGKADINEIINSFLYKLREVTGLSDNKLAAVPLAVVISKTDSAGLDQEIGEIAVNKMMKAEPETYKRFYDTQDYLCRKFLKENNMENFLNIISMQFENNRFFSCSAIGHTRDIGQYKPKGVLPPMQWIFGMADSRIGQIWNDVSLKK